MLTMLMTVGLALAGTKCGTLGDSEGGLLRERAADAATLDCVKEDNVHDENTLALRNGAVGAGLTQTVYKDKDGKDRAITTTGTATGESFVKTNRGTIQAIGKKTAPTAALVAGGVSSLRGGATTTFANYLDHHSPAAGATDVLRTQEGGRKRGSGGSSKVEVEVKVAPAPIPETDEQRFQRALEEGASVMP